MSEIDQGWLALQDAPSSVRLRWAREQAGYASGRAFARAARLQENTYTAYERDPDTAAKSIRLSVERAMEFATLLKVRWEWLFYGRGTPFEDEARDPVKQRLLDAYDNAAPEAREAIVAAVELLSAAGGSRR